MYRSINHNIGGCDPPTPPTGHTVEILLAPIQKGVEGFVLVTRESADTSLVKHADHLQKKCGGGGGGGDGGGGSGGVHRLDFAGHMDHEASFPSPTYAFPSPSSRGGRPSTLATCFPFTSTFPEQGPQDVIDMAFMIPKVIV